MTEPEPELSLARQAAQLSIQVEGLSQSVSALARKQRQDRLMLQALFVGLVMHVVALTLIAVIAVRADHAAQRADSAYAIGEANKEAARLSCEAANQGRATQIELWTVVLDLAVQANPTPTRQEALRIAQFRTYIQKVFAPRDCSQPITPTSPVPTPTGTPR